VPSRFDPRDDEAGGAHGVPSGVGEADKLRAPIPWVRAAFDDAEPLEVVDELRHGRQRHARCMASSMHVHAHGPALCTVTPSAGTERTTNNPAAANGARPTANKPNLNTFTQPPKRGWSVC
jgi:hypothetical protein